MIKHSLSVPVDCVIVGLVAKGCNVPPHTLAEAGIQSTEIAENTPIDCVLHSAFFPVLFIENHEQSSKFLIDVTRSRVGRGSSHPPPRHYDGTDQAEIRLFLFHYM